MLLSVHVVLSSERTLYFVALECSLTVQLQGPRLNDINRGILVNNDIMQAARLGEFEAIRTALRHGTSALGQNIMGHTGNNTKPSGTYPNPSKQKCLQSSYTNIWFFFFYWEGERDQILLLVSSLSIQINQNSRWWIIVADLHMNSFSILLQGL